MKIGILAADSHNFPNLPLMKISAFYKANGHEVEWWKAEGEYDIVFCSVIFSETEIPEVNNAKRVCIGGSGIDLDNRLPPEIEHTTPDYSIYPQYNFAVGFLTRGCPRLNHARSRGGFCITPEKDGCTSRKVADLSEFWTGQKKISLLDQNLLACKDRIELINQLAASRAEIDFKGGLDARYVNEEVVAALKQIKARNYFFAWDDPKEDLSEQFEYIASSGIKNPDRIGVYVLTNFWSTEEQDLYRVQTLRKIGLLPFVMIYDKQRYVDEHGKWKKGIERVFTREELRHFKICQYLQRWSASRALMKSCPKFEDYDMYKRMMDGDERWLPPALRKAERGMQK